MLRNKQIHASISNYSTRGFTLIEIVMVIVLLGILGSTILAYFAGLGGTSDQALSTQANFLAQEKMDLVIADKKANGFNGVIAEAAASLPSPYDNFTREVEVICVDEADLNADDTGMPGCSGSDISAKRVRVILSWADRSLDLVTVLSDH
jgi:prepilin-type N-terminal cleavage/methylation domain-containing protein